jgi:GR25 family glycosyltransferase involved in LPS biosynthesis
MEPFKKIPCLVIHRSQDKERQILIDNLAVSLGRPLQNVEAADGSFFVQNGFPTRHPLTGQTTPGNIGCTASHVHILESALEIDETCLCIFEDDAVVIKSATEYLENIPDDWDLCFLGVNEKVDVVRTTDLYVQILRFWGTHAVLVRKRAMEAILETYKKSVKDGIALPADWLYSYAIRDHGLVAYAPVENCVIQKPGLVSTCTGSIRQ